MLICDLEDNYAVHQQLSEEFSGTVLTYIPIDVTKRESIEGVYQTAANTVDRIDVVINGCGLMNDRFIDRTIDINLVSSIRLETK